MKSTIERFFLKITLYVGLIAAGITSMVEVFKFRAFAPDMAIDLMVILSLITALILLRYKRMTLSALLAVGSLLLLMTVEIINANYLKQGSLAVLLVIAFANSIVFRGKLQLFMHTVSFGLMSVLVFYLHSNGVRLQDGSSMISMAINLLVIYFLIGFTASKIKSKYDGLILELHVFNQNLETEVQDRTRELESYKDKLELLVAQRTSELENTLSELQNTQSHLIQAEKMAALGTLAAGLGHEINNPLNFIRGGFELLTKEIDGDAALQEQFQPFLSLIDEGTMRAGQIVKSLSNFSHKGMGDYRECHLHEIIDNCLTLMRNLLVEGITIKKNYSEEVISTIGNEGELHQVFMNILLNAVQSIINQGEITVETKAFEDHVLITITDSGVGMTEEQINRVFEPFFTTKEPGVGTGLGLSISYKIIQNHKGTIQFESAKGKGTSVDLKFPTPAFAELPV